MQVCVWTSKIKGFFSLVTSVKTKMNLLLYAVSSWYWLSAVLTHFFIPSAKHTLAFGDFLFLFFFMFHQKCFSGTNQNKQNPTSLLLVVPLPKRVQGTQWRSICLRCYWRHSGSKCSFHWHSFMLWYLKNSYSRAGGKEKGIFWIGWKIFNLLSTWFIS